jgi:MerR family transcriptional regulator, light-induced transcriptional regulator
MGAYTIRELENLSGIKAHTIRIWEKRYGLIAPQRTSTNIRTYCDSELKKLLNISILNRNGLKISKIARLSSEEIVRKINQYTQDLSSTENQIESLSIAMIDLDEFKFEQVLARAVIQFGFEEAVTKVLYPFLVKIGLMWQTGSVNPVQEHFITNLVRRKFFVALDGLVAQERSGMPVFVFFLPEGEMHEIGLLFSCFLAKRRGFKTVYLGQSLPLNDLSEIVRMREVNYLFTTMISSYNGHHLTNYLETLSERFMNKIVFISGSQLAHYHGYLPDNIRILESPEQFIVELARLLPQTTS